MTNFNWGGRGLSYFKDYQVLSKSSIHNKEIVLRVEILWIIATIIIFCVLFSNSDLLWGKAYAQTPQQRDTASFAQPARERAAVKGILAKDLLNIEEAVIMKRLQNREAKLKINDSRRDFVKYPLYEYHIDTTKLGYIVPGETIPKQIWEMPLRIINHPEGKDTTSLRELSSRQFLILDFWARWCKPCVASMNKWESIKEEISSDVTVVGVHMDHDYKAAINIEEFGWTGIQIIGKEAHILQRYLMRDYILGPSVWIKDQQLFGISNAGTVDVDRIKNILNGGVNQLPDNFDTKLY